MKQRFKQLALFIVRYKFWNGIILFLKFQAGLVSNIRLPRIQHPIFLRSKTSDLPTFYQVFLENYYLLDFAKKPKVVIDGGANVGLFAITVKNEFPESKVICIEPDPENFEVLHKNLSPYKDVYFENSGLWNKDTKLKVYDKYNSGKWGMVVEEDLKDGKVPAICLSSLIRKYGIDRIDVLKIDIETSEKQVFAEGYEEWLPKVRTLIIELHDWMEEGCSRPFFEAVNKSFRNYHYSMCGENTIIINRDIE